MLVQGCLDAGGVAISVNKKVLTGPGLTGWHGEKICQNILTSTADMMTKPWTDQAIK